MTRTRISESNILVAATNKVLTQKEKERERERVRERDKDQSQK